MTSAAFWLMATLLAVAAFGFLAWPLWRQQQAQGRRSALSVGAAIATVPLAVVIYLAISTWEPDADADLRADPHAMVAQLAARLEESPNDPMGWRMLGRGYRVLGQYELARQAFLEAWTRTPEPDNDLTLSLAEAQVLADPSTLLGEAGRLIEEVLGAEPNNPTALWYGGLMARAQGDVDAATSRWNRLLEFNPPEDIANIIRREMAAMDPGAQAAASASAGAEASSEGGQAAVGAPGASIRVRVSLGEDTALERLGPAPTLFVFARVPGQRAPVAAQIARAPALPAEFTLSDEDAMLPGGLSLADFDELTLVARLSASGDAMEQPGDVYAQATYRSDQDETVELVIDRVVE